MIVLMAVLRGIEGVGKAVVCEREAGDGGKQEGGKRILYCDCQ